MTSQRFKEWRERAQRTIVHAMPTPEMLVGELKCKLGDLGTVLDEPSAWEAENDRLRDLVGRLQTRLAWVTDMLNEAKRLIAEMP